MAEEVHFIYPEGAGNLERAKGNPQHEFFKRFGQSMPEADWNDPGTKQGVYMIGPDAEYLEGGGAISGDPENVRERLERALKRWKKLKKEKDYAEEDVPAVATGPVPEVAEKPLVLRVFLRDLPRGKGDDTGRRFTKADLRGMWLDFTKWAWNVNWLGLDDPRALVPNGKQAQPVADETFRQICREALVDNVRGQNPHWRPNHVRLAELTMQRLDDEDGLWVIECQGKAELRSEQQSYVPALYGRATWDPKEKAFRTFELLAIGQREGAGRFNQRSRDRGPAPMGVVLELYAPPAAE